MQDTSWHSAPLGPLGAPAPVSPFDPPPQTVPTYAAPPYPSGAPSGGAPMTPPIPQAPSQPPQQTEAPRSIHQVVESTRAFWTIQFWQQFFDVDAIDVQSRITSSLWPFKPPQYLEAKNFSYAAFTADPEVVGRTPDIVASPADSPSGEQPRTNTNADLYGPTWIACTLWLMIAVVAQLTREFNCEKGSTDKACQSGWMGPVVAAAGVIFGYQLAVPFVLWLGMKWKDVPVSLVDTICLYGYSLFVFIPTSLICLVPWSIVQWLAMLIAFIISVSNIVFNLFGIWKRHLVSKWFSIVLFGCIFLHFVLCASFKLQFFTSLTHHKKAADIPPAVPAVSPAVPTVAAVGPKASPDMTPKPSPKA
uniref:Protein YIPF n=1 Tax=Eutreptiella gymnastica TaxID=73025 RepID=A0A7S4GC81_9EUGL